MNQNQNQQYNLICGFLPHEEQCHRNGQCEGCKFAETIKQKEKYICPLCGSPLHDEVYIPDFHCSKCGQFVEGVKV